MAEAIKESEKLGKGSEAQGLERSRVGGRVRRAERSQDQVTGIGDAERHWPAPALICSIGISVICLRVL